MSLGSLDKTCWLCVQNLGGTTPAFPLPMPGKLEGAVRMENEAKEKAKQAEEAAEEVRRQKQKLVSGANAWDVHARGYSVLLCSVNTK